MHEQSLGLTPLCFSFFFLLILIFGCIWSLLLCMGFLQLWRAGATLHCVVWTSHFGGFSCCRARALGAQGSVVVACRLSSCSSWALERRLSSCGARAQLLHGMWDLSGPGLEPVSPVLAGGFLTTAPPGEPYVFLPYLTVTTLYLIFLKYIKQQGAHGLLNYLFSNFEGLAFLYILKFYEISKTFCLYELYILKVSILEIKTEFKNICSLQNNNKTITGGLPWWHSG